MEENKKKLSTKIWEKQNKNKNSMKSWKQKDFGSFGRISRNSI